MTIKPIRTEQEHAEALARIDRLFAAKRGTAEFDELEVITTLVDAYERAHVPIESQFSGLSLVEKRLLIQGLHIAGEQNRVEYRLVPAWRDLLRRLVASVEAGVTKEPSS